LGVPEEPDEGVYSYTLDSVTIWEIDINIDLDTKFEDLDILIENVEELVMERLESLG
jgi:hypothetical protein